MKKLLALATLVILTASCNNLSHNFNLVGEGKVFRVGNETCNLTYVNGLFSLTASRENTESVIETSDSDAVDGTPSASLSGVKSIRWRTSPQVTGYLVDLAKISPEAAEAYVQVMPKMHKAQWNPVLPEPIEPASPPAASGQQATSKRQASGQQAEGDAFVCNGDCTFTDLSSHDDVAWLMGAVTALTAYDCSETMPETGETYAETLKDYAHILSVYAEKGRKTCPLVLLAVTVEARKVTYLRYGWKLDDGTAEEVQCPNCTGWEISD